MTFWIPLVVPVTTFIASKLPPLPGFEPIPEISDEEYVIVDHHAYEGAVSQPLPKREPQSTDEKLSEDKNRQTGGSNLQRDLTESEIAVADLMQRINSEITEESNDSDWRWLCNCDVKNRDIWIYNKRRASIESQIKTNAEARYYFPLARDIPGFDEELRVLDMARRMLDMRFEAKYDYLPPREMWADPQESNK